jgi:hypothetical protein
MPELKLCPFCAANMAFTEKDTLSESWQVRCLDCGCGGPWEDSKDAAARVWNERPTEERAYGHAMKPKSFPHLISTRQVADILGWRVEKSRRWLIGAGLAVKLGGRWFTTREKLVETFPNVFHRIFADLDYQGSP